MKPKPTIDRLHEVLICDPIAGRLYWRERPVRRSQDKTWNSRYAGKETFIVNGSKGYLLGKVDHIGLRAHHVIWAMEKGRWPSLQIDHINGDPKDNRISNLREVTQNANMLNRKAYEKKSGLPPGVNYNSRGFMARIQRGGQTRYLGTFPTKEEAHKAYLKAVAQLGFSSRHGT
ncbi:HNH endonuclease signature motif containing protein [Phaeobacter sp. PT47_59]|uniref:HNH endonuclease signature motif containing protein n=1 Tax=Phaeobacter sp. PT47_59 TaxID=3029979 RepID=UPI002380B0C5|nr:HNH endonuclease signature motif containing protein [Phaeobacter sp. PT47_59]MDE4176360.1 HNH endonuclease signature motif containing protein [Phaeobacter sp. PT47_59]